MLTSDELFFFIYMTELEKGQANDSNKDEEDEE